MTAEEERRIAEFVYPALVDINKNEILVYQNHEWAIFSPSLAGSDRAKAQALDCIVAADRIPSRTRDLHNRLCQQNRKDILTEALCAIRDYLDLQNKLKAMK